MEKYKGYLAFDFDGVIASHSRPWKYDKIGKPNIEVIETINYFYNQGYHINIFTGRQRTPDFISWLVNHGVKFHTINANPKDHLLACPYKPYYQCFVDDKAVNYHWKNNKLKKKQLIKKIKTILEWSQQKTENNE